MGTHDSSDPPPLATGQPSADSTGQWIVEKVRKSREDSRDALELSRKHEDKIQRHEEILGSSPNQALGLPGSGLLGGISNLNSKIDDLKEGFDNLVKEITAERAEAEKRRAAFWFVAKIVVSTVVGSGVVGSIAWIVTLHH